MTVLMVLLHIALVAGVVVAVGISERRPGLCCAIWAAATAFWVCAQMALGLFYVAALQLCTVPGIVYLTVGGRSWRSASPSQEGRPPGPKALTLAETAAPACATRQQHPTAPTPTRPSP